jgi:hypothetical protein
MDEPTKHFLIPWLMAEAGAALLLLWGVVLIYLEKRDRKRQQQ